MPLVERVTSSATFHIPRHATGFRRIGMKAQARQVPTSFFEVVTHKYKWENRGHCRDQRLASKIEVAGRFCGRER